MLFGAFKKRRVKCFQAVYERSNFLSRHDLGYQLVPVAKIVGSVGRCQVLDHRFRPLVRISRGQYQRYKRIGKLMRELVVLPPVELYRLRDEYYVVDGHHRVAAAKEMGAVHIDARVIEFLPGGESAEDRLFRERREFERRTGLSDIILSELGQYHRLLEQIQEHQTRMIQRAHERGGDVSPTPVNFKEAARDWELTVFRPVVELIEGRGIQQRVKGKTSADLYLWAWDHKRLEGEKTGHDISWDKALDYFDALYPSPTWGQRLVERTGPFAKYLRRILPLPEPPEPCALAFEATTGAWYCRRRTRSGLDTHEAS